MLGLVMFLGVIAAGVAFLVWFLVALVREQSASVKQPVHILRVTQGQRIQLTPFKDGAFAKHQPLATARLIWRYGTSHANVEKEPTCGISSSYS